MRGTPRLEFGIIELSDGFPIMPMVIGLLAFSEVLRQIEIEVIKILNKRHLASSNNRETESAKDPNQRVNLKEFKGVIRTILRSTGIGSAMGIIPGIGTTVAAYLSYISAKRVSKEPELFGKGSLEGIASCEAGNNAVVGPNLVPLVTLGIPGNLAAALILGGFMIKGLTPGPMFMQENAPLLYGLFTVLLISNLYTFLVGNFFVRYVRKVTQIPKPILFTSILIFSVIGSYVFQSSIFDIFMMFCFGILGYIFTKLRINLPTIIVAFFLGPLFERKIRQALTISGGDATVFFTRPIALAFFILTIVGVIFLIRRKKKMTVSAE
jgi:putative tricarboxylic transport membrane protein